MKYGAICGSWNESEGITSRINAYGILEIILDLPQHLIGFVDLDRPLLQAIWDCFQYPDRPNLSVDIRMLMLYVYMHDKDYTYLRGCLH